MYGFLCECTGGSDCAVNAFADALGHVITSSGPDQLGRIMNGSFMSDERGVQLDASFPDDCLLSDYYNPEYIVNFVTQLEASETSEEETALSEAMAEEVSA